MLRMKTKEIQMTEKSILALGEPGLRLAEAVAQLRRLVGTEGHVHIALVSDDAHVASLSPSGPDRLLDSTAPCGCPQRVSVSFIDLDDARIMLVGRSHPEGRLHPP